MFQSAAQFECKPQGLHRRMSHLISRRLASGLAFFIALSAQCDERAPLQAANSDSAQMQCLPSGDGFLRARLNGAIQAELDWRNADTECTGSIRPNNGGLRMRFKHKGLNNDDMVILFGITGLAEGQSGKALPVNVTVIVEGSGKFFGTQGDNKCTVDEVKQEPLAGIPLRKRSYRVLARGFCTQPARAVKGSGSILITRFDYAGRVDFNSDENSPDPNKT